jgi:hypothetical protein
VARSAVQEFKVHERRKYAGEFAEKYELVWRLIILPSLA